MRLLADENVPRLVVEGLREAGHDVLWVATEVPGADDPPAVELAMSGDRLLLTLDKDFGELAFTRMLSSDAGVVLCRLSSDSPDVLSARLVAPLRAVETWAGMFSVIEDDRVRSTPPPSRRRQEFE